MAAPTKAEIQYWMAHKDDNLQPNILAACIICLILPYIAVGLRLSCRRIMEQRLWIDDWLIIAALVPLTGMQIAGIMSVRLGFGVHIIFAPDIVGFAKSEIAVISTYSITILVTKMSILFFYYRVIPTRTIAIGSSLIGTITVLYSGALFAIMFALCSPLQKFWTPTMPGTCINTTPAFLTLAITNVVTDLAILALPIKSVWGLHMSTTRKWQVSGVFALGGVVCIFGTIRAAEVGKASTADVTWANVQGGIWSSVEVSVGIVCACLPTLAPLASKSVRPKRSRKYYYPKGSRGSDSRHADAVRLAPRSQEGCVWSDISAKEASVVNHQETQRTPSPGAPQFGGIRVNNEVTQSDHDFHSRA